MCNAAGVMCVTSYGKLIKFVWFWRFDLDKTVNRYLEQENLLNFTASPRIIASLKSLARIRVHFWTTLTNPPRQSTKYCDRSYLLSPSSWQTCGFSIFNHSLLSFGWFYLNKIKQFDSLVLYKYHRHLFESVFKSIQCLFSYFNIHRHILNLYMSILSCVQRPEIHMASNGKFWQNTIIQSNAASMRKLKAPL